MVPHPPPTPNNPLTNNTDSPNNLRPSPLPPNLPRRHNRLRPHRLHPLNRSRSLRRRNLSFQFLPSTRRTALRRGTGSSCFDCFRWKFYPPCY